MFDDGVDFEGSCAGIKHPARVLNFVHQGTLAPLAVGPMPAEGAPDDPVTWLTEAAQDFLGFGPEGA